MSERLDVVAGPPETLDWSVFASCGICISSLSLTHIQRSKILLSPSSPSINLPISRFPDPEILKTLATSSRAEHLQQNQPHTYQRSELSDLQLLVKNARATIVDPVLKRLSEGTTETPSSARLGKPKSETYKVAWSVSEQHLLERLLEEIPEGEKQRCADKLSLLFINFFLVIGLLTSFCQLAEDFQSYERSSNTQAGS